MAGRTKFGDLVIIVPGVLGSRLLYNGSPLWGDKSPTFLQWAQHRAADLAHLSIGSDDPALEDLGDGIVPDGLVQGIYVVGRFARVGGYARLTSALQNRFSLKLGSNLQHFAYDWRRDLRVAARRLAVKAEGWLQSWRSQSGNRDAKIVLVCHAMGGLVGRAFVDIEGGWPAIRAILTIGTPFQGSIRALDLLYFGLDFQSYGLAHHDLTSVVRTFTSVYQMLPHYPAVRGFSGDVVSPFEIRIPTFENQKIERAKQFHRDLIDHHHRNRRKPGYQDVVCKGVVGVGQPTAELGRLLPNGTLSIDGEPAEHDGDGIVPRFSAEAPAASGFGGHWFYVPQTSGMLLSDPLAQALIGDLLEDRGAAAPATPLPRFTLRRAMDDSLRIESDGLSLSVSQPFYKVGQPVEIRLAARSATGHAFPSKSMRVGVRVEQIRHVGKRVAGKIVRLTPHRDQPGTWAGSLRAPAPGSYRVTAVSNHRLLAPFHVSELFEVD